MFIFKKMSETRPRYAKRLKTYETVTEDGGESIVRRTFIGDIVITNESNPNVPKHLDGTRWFFKVTKHSKRDAKESFFIDVRFVDSDEDDAQTVKIPPNVVLLGSDGLPLNPSNDDACFDASGHPYCGFAYLSDPPVFLKFVHFGDDCDHAVDFKRFTRILSGIDSQEVLKGSPSESGRRYDMTMDELFDPNRVFSHQNRVDDGRMWFDSFENMEKVKKKVKWDISNDVPIILKCCWTCKLVRSDLPTCAKCKDVYYCSRECQKKDFQNHKKECVKSSNVNK